MSSRRLHKPFTIAEAGEGRHKFAWLGLDEADLEKGVLTNQYLIVDGGKGLLVDPGGYFVFQRLYSAVSELIDPARVSGVFYSHQDPDVVGSLNLILDFFPNATVYVSSLWTRFLPHLGALAGLKIREIPDEGAEIPLGEASLEAVPAHFLHSPGNFSLYDPAAGVLFSGDIGAAVFPEGEWYLFVEDFERHKRFMEGFHKRYLCCRRALDAWIRRARALEPEIIAPQHGAIFQGRMVHKFLDWLESLGPVGVNYLYP